MLSPDAKKNLIAHLNEWCSANRNYLVSDIKVLARIPSVTQNTPGPHPFGEPCAQVVDAAEQIIRRLGLEVKPCDYYGISAVLPGETPERIGFFSHLDVVPAGDGWKTPPFEPDERDNYLIGRGVSDNKGPAVVCLYTLKFFKDHGLPLKRGLEVFLGANEEAGMEDVAHYVQVTEPPALSLVADCGFPVCYGEKGILMADFAVSLPKGRLLGIHAGTASNIVPDYAAATLDASTKDNEVLTVEKLRSLLPEDFEVQPGEEGRIVVVARGVGGHAAFPDNSVNALQKLAAGLRKSGAAGKEAEPVLAFIDESFRDFHGQGLNIAFEDEISGKTTHVGSLARSEAGELKIGINVRYAVTSPQGEFEGRLKAKAAAYGFTLAEIKNNPPYHRSGDNPVVSALNTLVNESLGTGLKPYVMGGGTYARKLPRALGFGPGQKIELPRSLGITGGGAHQANEAQSIDALMSALKIYIKAIITLEGFDSIAL
jgi:succinyl-diaminopimelate desuccinylase